MSAWNRDDAEMAIAIKRAELNRALTYKSNYDSEGHNICLALVEYKGGGFDALVAYSHDSAVPESLRLGLNLVPNLYGELSGGHRFGCDGMAQYHTEPKLLNYLCATPAIRQGVLGVWLPRNDLYSAVLKKQRAAAARHAGILRSPAEFSSVTLVTEIDCCSTCTRYSIGRFKGRFPAIPLEVIELGKKPGSGVPPQFKKITITTG